MSVFDALGWTSFITFILGFIMLIIAIWAEKRAAWVACTGLFGTTVAIWLVNIWSQVQW